MFGFFKKATPPSAEIELIDLMKKLENANSTIIAALHISLCTQINIFNSKYKTIDSFEEASKKEKFDYLTKLLNMEQTLNQQKMFAESVACKMLGLYLATYLENRNNELIQEARSKLINFIETETL